MEENLVNKVPENSAVEVADDAIQQLRILAIDAHIFSLQYLCAVLHKCNCKVQTTTSAADALEILRANKHGFDIVLVDVDSANLNGFKLMEIIGLEMYLPVIMVTGDSSLENTMKGLVYGAVNYIIKPVGVQEIKNIWHCLNPDKIWDSEQPTHTQETSPLEHSNANTVTVEDDKAGVRFDDASSSCQKKRRLVWTPELEAKFIKAVQTLSKSSTVHPKRILQIMNEPGLTRGNVASHLQKYRISMKKRKADVKKLGFDTERAILCSSTTRTNCGNEEVGKVKADHVAVPSFNGVHSFEDMNVFLQPIGGRNSVMSQHTTPYGSLLDRETVSQSLLSSCLDDPSFQAPDFKSFDYCLGMNNQPHNLGSEPLLGTTSWSCFHGVGFDQPSTSSSVPFYPHSNVFLAPDTDIAFQSAFAVGSVPYLAQGDQTSQLWRTEACMAKQISSFVYPNVLDQQMQLPQLSVPLPAEQAHSGLQIGGGSPNYGGLLLDCTNNLQYPGFKGLTSNIGETELAADGTTKSQTTDISFLHNLELDDNLVEIDENQFSDHGPTGSL